MKVNYISDVHLEFGTMNVANPNNAEVLLLCGDIFIAEDIKRFPFDVLDSNSSTDSYRKITSLTSRDFLTDCAKLYKHVLVVMGNHEHYGGEIDRSAEILKTAFNTVSPNIKLLDNETVEINDVLFVGSTLWSSFNNRHPVCMWTCNQNMSDYTQIRIADKNYRKLTTNYTADLHSGAVKFITDALAKNNSEGSKPVVIMTHHAPTYHSIPSIFKSDNLLNGAYASDLSSLIIDNAEIKHWVHGHIHAECEYAVGNHCTVHCNPRGYVGLETTNRNFILRSFDV